MPVYSAGFSAGPLTQPNPQALISAGPILPVQIAIPTALEQLLQSQGQPIPQPVSGWALIDTGATRSAVDTGVITNLQINQIGVVNLGTAGGGVTAPIFPARFTVAPGTPTQMVIEFSSVVGVNLRGQAAIGQNVIALIGREVLSRGIFVYNGPQGTYSFAL